jgi:hypothetical protein
MADYTVDVTIGASTYTAGVLNNVQITYGRQRVTDAVAAAACSVEILQSSSLGSFPATAISLGATLTVSVTVSGYGAANRFTGLVTDVQADWRVVRVIAAAYPLAQLSRMYADIPAYTSVLTGTAVQNILNIANGLPGLPVTATVSPGTVTITTPAQTNANLMQAIQNVVQNEPSGVLRDGFANDIVFDDYAVRRVLSPVFTIASSEIGLDWRATKAVAAFCNTATVTYNTSQTVTTIDTASTAASGIYGQSVSLQIDNDSDAAAAADRLVAHGLNPSWQLDNLVVDVGGMSSARQDLFRDNVVVGAFVQIPALMAGTQTQFFVEGWSENITRTTWFTALYLSDKTLTQAAQRYVDVVSGVTYATVTPATLRWFDLNNISI